MDGFLTGLVIGFMLFAGVVYFIPGSYHRLAYEAISKCEESLPRNRTCTVKGVPE